MEHNLNLKPINTELKLYHGSPLVLKNIKPMPSRILDGTEAVYAAAQMSVAACFCTDGWTDKDIELGLINGDLYIKELKVDAFKLLEQKGYIYELKNKDFYTCDELTSFEFISLEEHKPIRSLSIKNPLDFIIEQRKMEVIRMKK